MIHQTRPDLRPMFRSASPYADEVDAEDAARGATSPPPAGWNAPRWSMQPQPRTHWGYTGGPPAPGMWQPAPWTAPTPPRPRRRRPGLGAVTAVLLLAGVASVAGGAELAHLTSQSSSAPGALLIPLASPAPSAPGSAALPGATATPAPSTPAPSPAATAPATPLTNAQIAAAVDPAIVDVTSTLPNQGGIGAGTGMVITSSGEVLTNNHVIAGASRIQVLIGGVGRPYTAHVIGADPSQDVAVLQIDSAPAGMRTISAGDSSTVAVGDAVLALGNALGKQGAPTAAPGTVTALDQTITATDQGGGNSETLTGLIEVNARIQPGDSGGPLANRYGQVIGMNTAASSSRRNGGGTTDGYAIAMNSAMTVAHQLEQSHSGATPSSPSQAPATTRAFLGISSTDGSTAGATITGVQSGSPADQAGMQAGDVIVRFGGTQIRSAAALGPAIRAHQPGDSVRVDWVDPDGQQHSATVTLAGV